MEVLLNGKCRNIKDVIVYDKIPDGLSLVESSIKFQQKTGSSTWNTISSAVTLLKSGTITGYTDAAGTGQSFQLGVFSSGTAYGFQLADSAFATSGYTIGKVTYETKVTNYFVENDTSTYFTNSAKLLYHWYEYGKVPPASPITHEIPTAEKRVDVVVNNIKKEVVKYDKKTHEITWRVVVNQHHRDYSDKVLTITDKMEGIDGMTTHATQKFVDGSIAMENGTTADGGAFPAVSMERVSSDGCTVSGADAKGQYYFNSDVDKLYSSINDTLKFYFKNVNDNKIVFTYKTIVTNPNHYTYNDNTKPTYKNQVTQNVEGTSACTSIAQVELESNILSKQAGTYNYATHEIEWTVVVNGNKQALPNIKLTDSPVGQRVIAGSIQSTPALPAGSVTTISPDNKTLTITMGDIADTYTIKYKTKVVADEIPAFVTNHVSDTTNIANDVQMTRDPLDGSATDQQTRITAEAKAPVKNYACVKTGVQQTGNGDYVDYQIVINQNGRTLTPGTLEDVMSSKLCLDIDSVELWTATIDANGVASKQSRVEEVSPANKKVRYLASSHLLQVDIPATYGTNSTPTYVLKYRAYLDCKQESKSGNYYDIGTVGNSASYGVTGSHIVSTSSLMNVRVLVSKAGGSGTMKESYTITVTDKKTGDPIKNVTFDLVDDNGNVVSTGTTDDDGKITFRRLKTGHYNLVSTGTPDGYDRVELTVNVTTESSQNEADVELVSATSPTPATPATPTPATPTPAVPTSTPTAKPEKTMKPTNTPNANKATDNKSKTGKEGKKKSPQTGDEAPIKSVMLVGIVSVGALIAMIVSKKKKKAIDKL